MGLGRRWLILIIACGFGLLSTGLQSPSADDNTKDEEYYELMRTFVETFEQIDRNYVKDVDRRELMEAAIQGMIGKLDQYSSYISPEEVTSFNEDVDKEFGGIGIQVQVNPDSKRLTVTTPLPGTPAYRAGVRSGDKIMEIEGQNTEGFSINDAVKLLKGPAGEAVQIGIQHENSDDVEQVKIVREVIQVASVLGDTYNEDGTWNYWLDEDDKVAYIRLTSFSRRTSDELQDVLLSLTQKGMKSLVLDLRFNPGGLLSQAVQIADLFVDSGTIVSTKGRNTDERVWKANRAGSYTDFPMAVLVNRYSASASEILSACLQDHDRAKVVGERTWGKGSVQNVIELDGGESAIKLTTASYFRPSKRKIHRFPGDKESDEWGVKPNDGLDVRFSRGEMEQYLNYRRRRDVIRSDGPPKSDFDDRQLSKALDAIESTGNEDADKAAAS